MSASKRDRVRPLAPRIASVPEQAHEALRDLIGVGPADRLASVLEHGGLADLRACSVHELRTAYGLSPAAARKVQAARVLAQHLTEATTVRGAAFRSSVDIFKRFHADLRDLVVEQFWAVLLDGKHRIRRTVLVSQGSLTSSQVHPREAFAPAIRERGVAAVAFVHNHPSGDPSPSADDLDITRRLCEVGDLVGIRVLDHVIVGEDRYVSLADRGLMRV